MNVTIFGLSITSSWGNGHTVTFRALCRALRRRGHKVTFFERDTEWYRAFRDPLPAEFGEVVLYDSLAELERKANDYLAESNCVVVGSFVPEGVAVAHWVLKKSRHACCCFYDLDTPITLSKLQSGDEEYISAALLARFDYYLSFAGGPVLDRLAKRFAVQAPIAFWCCVDPEIHFPRRRSPEWDLAYLGTYSSDRQPKLNELMLEPARALPAFSFAVCGPLYPPEIVWLSNVTKLEHANPLEHAHFYGGQRFCLNLTRDEMVRNGYSPSTRLFEAAACGTAIVSDWWPGIETFFTPEREILIAQNRQQMVEILLEYPDQDRLILGERARERVLSNHTAEQRVMKLEALVRQQSDLTSKSSVTL